MNQPLACVERVAIIGLGLLGGSIGLAIAEHLPGVTTAGYDADPAVRTRAAERGLANDICDTAAGAVAGADLVILCVPVGAMGAAAGEIAASLAPGCIVSDVGSSKQSVKEALHKALPGAAIIPAHPVAGTEHSGPDAGFSSLFHNRWCIVTPDDQTDPRQLTRLVAFWEALGANVELMSAEHHDSAAISRPSFSRTPATCPSCSRIASVSAPVRIVCPRRSSSALSRKPAASSS